LSIAANNNVFDGDKTITAKDRLEALLMAEINEEKARLCSKDQGPLRVTFEMNAKLFRRIAT
jgi:hypothetical protein